MLGRAASREARLTSEDLAQYIASGNQPGSGDSRWLDRKNCLLLGQIMVVRHAMLNDEIK